MLCKRFYSALFNACKLSYVKDLFKKSYPLNRSVIIFQILLNFYTDKLIIRLSSKDPIECYWSTKGFIT